VESFKGRRVLVTGAEGFIGSHLVEGLLRDGADVRALIRYDPQGGRGWLVEGVQGAEVVAGDIRDPGRVAQAVEGREVVFHLAALIGIPYSYLAPSSYIDTNIGGTYNVLEACRRSGVERLVHTSTSEVYGTARKVPIDESHPLQPQSPYSASKIGADAMALAFQHSFGLPVAVIRPFNTYGPRQSARAVIPTVLTQLHSGGDELRLGSTSPSRDFNYIDDTVAGFLAVAQCERAVGEVVNVGSGTEITIGDLVEMLFEITGRKARVLTEPERVRPQDSEVERLVADITRAREWANYEPRTSLEEGLRTTSEWVKENLDKVRPSGYQV
jgi:NAD dependent epimerase/dehydratase